MEPGPHATKIEAIMRGNPDWRILAAEVGARYIYWGRMERAAYGDGEQPWRFTRRIRTGHDFEIYDLDTPSVPLDDVPTE